MVENAVKRLVIVGHGSIGKRHLRLARKVLPSADIRVLLRQKINSMDLMLSNGCFYDLEEACAFKPQLTIIANPAPFHVSVGLAFASAGSHLLMEKPISNGSSGVKELVQLCIDSDLQLYVGYNLRHKKSLQLFRSALVNQVVGEVHLVQCEVGDYLPNWRHPFDYRDSVSARKRLGGGALLELSHELDLIQWVFGEVSWVSGWMDKVSSLEIDVEDCASLTLGLEGNCIARVSMDLFRRDFTRFSQAICSNGTVRWDGVKGLVDVFRKDSKDRQVLYEEDKSGEDAYENQLTAVLKSIRTGEACSVSATGEEALKTLHLVEAARLSNSLTGKRMLVSFEND